MAFNAKYLTCLTGVSHDRPNIWVYKTDDDAETVDTTEDGYFPAGYGFKPGDLVYVVTVDDMITAADTVTGAALHVVTTVDTDGVDVGGATEIVIAEGDYEV